MLYIQTEDLFKKIGKNYLLRPITTTIDNQNIWLINGPNGSGKSTLIKILLKHLRHQGKCVTNLKSIAYAPEKNLFPDYISSYKFLETLCQVYQVKDLSKLNYLIELFSFTKHQHKMMHQLSKGNIQKVVLIQALMQEADAYLFDEPLSGLDPLGQNVFLKELIKYHQAGKLIIITTHFAEKYQFDHIKYLFLKNYQEDQDE